MKRAVPTSVAAIILLTAVWQAAPAPEGPARPGVVEPTAAVIVQGEELAAVAAAVRRAGGEITHELGIIDAVGAALSPAQLARLEGSEAVSRIYADGTAGVAGQTPYTHYPTLAGAELLHDEGITGYGVTVAVLDTGVSSNKALTENTWRHDRLLAHYDAILDDYPTGDSDENGHGSHVTGIIANSDVARDGSRKYNGMAPDVDLISVKAFGADGFGTYADVIRGLDWILAHQTAYGIRVANLSIAAPLRSYYWDDPLNQAVMRLWQAGIVVVVAAGNSGPAPMTVSVPGNVPYVITVGAMTDNYTPADPSDDFLASSSAAGPTFEAFVKPEVVAPGGHMLSVMEQDDQLAVDYPEFHSAGYYFTMSGTSQAAAWCCRPIPASPRTTSNAS